MNYKHYFSKIADLMLFAIDFQAGEKLMVNLEPLNHDIGIALAEKAYEKGADYVHFSYLDHLLFAAAIKGKKGDGPFWFPGFLKTTYDEACQEGWKYVALYSVEHNGVYKTLDKDLSVGYLSQLKDVNTRFKEAQMGGVLPWTLTFLPTPRVARRAFPDLTEAEALDTYWKYLVDVMGLEREDPALFWEETLAELTDRSRKLNEMGVESLHFSGPGTDLNVGVLEKSVWLGGPKTSVRGARFMSNIPSFEVYTSPDYRATEGRVALTRPFVMHQNLGAIPKGAWFEFKEGKIVDYGAEEGKESIDNLFKIDDRNRYIGEVALVDEETPIAQSGITFYNGLYDENAACHVALGQAYAMAYEGGSSMNEKERLAAGMNTAKAHEDMMIGSSKVDVAATLRDGGTVQIIENGKFVV
jgi:aminopeptidase